MDHKILFIVMNGEIKFLTNSSMDHREWYQSLGGSMDDYDNVIRGFIVNGKIIYFKSNLNYDDEVIDFAIKTGFKIKTQLHDMNLKVCCGINPGHDNMGWEPIVVLKDEDLEGYHTNDEPVVENTTPAQPMIEFKNDEYDPIFIQLASKFTLIMIGIAFVSKLILIPGGTMSLSNRWNALLMLAQFGGLILSLIGYRKKMPQTKIFSLVAIISSIFMFNFLDIIVGILTALFVMDHTIVLQILEITIMLSKKLSQWIKKVTSKQSSVGSVVTQDNTAVNMDNSVVVNKDNTNK